MYKIVRTKCVTYVGLSPKHGLKWARTDMQSRDRSRFTRDCPCFLLPARVFRLRHVYRTNFKKLYCLNRPSYDWARVKQGGGLKTAKLWELSGIGDNRNGSQMPKEKNPSGLRMSPAQNSPHASLVRYPLQVFGNSTLFLWEYAFHFAALGICWLETPQVNTSKARLGHVKIS